MLVRNQLEFYQSLSHDNWTLVKTYHGMKLFERPDHAHNIIYRAEFTINLNYNQVAHSLQYDEAKLQLFQIYNQLLLNIGQQLAVHEARYNFKYKNATHSFVDYHTRYSYHRPHAFMLIKQSIHQDNVPEEVLKRNRKLLKLDQPLNVIHLIQDQDHHDKCICLAVIALKKTNNNHNKLFAKFAKEQLINLTILNWDHQLKTIQ